MKNSKLKFRHAAGAGFILTLLLTQCIVPYESARMLPAGATEVKAAFSHGSDHYEGESESLSNNFGLGVGYGISDHLNLKVRYERIAVADSDGEGINYLAFGPKYAIVPDYVAVMMPLGVYFGDGESTWGIHPGLLFTLPAKNQRVEGTFGVRTDIFFEEGTEMLVGFNIGLGLSQDLERWAIRPDLGFVINPGEKGSILTLGVGVSYNITGRR